MSSVAPCTRERRATTYDVDSDVPSSTPSKLRRLAWAGVAIALVSTPACGDSAADDGTGANGGSADDGGSGGLGGNGTVGGAGGSISTGGAGGSIATGGAGGSITTGGAGGAGGGSLTGTCDAPHILTLDGAPITVNADIAAHVATSCAAGADLDSPSATAFFSLSVPAGTTAIVEADPALFGEGQLVIADLSACGVACTTYAAEAGGKTTRLLLSAGEHVLQIKSSGGASALTVRARTMNPLASGTCAAPTVLHPNDYVIATSLAPTPSGSNACQAGPQFYGAFFAIELPPYSSVAAYVSCNTGYYVTVDQVVSCSDISPLCAELIPCNQFEIYTNNTSLPQYRLLEFLSYLSPGFAAPYIIETTQL